MPDRTVGEFTINAETGKIAGPALYMEEQGNAWLGRLNQNLPAVVEFGYIANRERGYNETESMELAILVGIQTDYAGWNGFRQMFGAAR